MRNFIWTNKGTPLSNDNKGTNDKEISIKTILAVMAILVTILSLLWSIN